MNQLTTLEPRQAPLTVEDFEKIEELLQGNVKILTELRPVPMVDNNGEIYGYRSEAVQVGLAVKADINPKLREAIQRPATRQAIHFHLTKLSAHKRTTQGGTAFKVILEDACRDLEGCSEWAVVKAYDKLRNEDGDFFPSLKRIVEVVKWFHSGVTSIQPKEQPTMQQIEKKKRTDEDKARVAKVMHDAGIPHDKEFCAQCQKT